MISAPIFAAVKVRRPASLSDAPVQLATDSFHIAAARALPKAEQEISVAPSIWRAKS